MDTAQALALVQEANDASAFAEALKQYLLLRLRLPSDVCEDRITRLVVFSVKMQIRVRNGHTEHFNLWNGVIHETLAEFVVGETFDFPGETSGAVWRVIIVWPEHH